MKYNIVLNDKGWVMEQIGKHLLKYLPDSYMTFREPHDEDANIYLNWHGFKRKNKIDIPFFTHLEPNQEHFWNNSANWANICLCMGMSHYHMLPEHKTIVFNPPPFEEFLSDRKLKLLVVGREYKSGRKNFGIALDKDKVDITYTEGRLSQDELIQAYRDTDYVLVTSKNEAGPMCVVEAIALGKPVIAPNVGWCWKYPCIRYDFIWELKEIVSNLVFAPNIWEVRTRTLDDQIRTMLNEQQLIRP
jgi:hypothetical protein